MRNGSYANDPIHINDTINMELSICVLRGLRSNFINFNTMFVPEDNVLNLSKSADLDEMPHYMLLIIKI